MKIRKIYSSLLLILFFSGCGSETSTSNENTEDSSSQTVNKVPLADAGVDKTVTVNETVTIVGTVSDSDGIVVSHEWKNGNNLLSENLSFEYTPTIVGTDILTLNIMDDDGAEIVDSINIIVVNDNGTDSNGNPIRTKQENER